MDLMGNDCQPYESGARGGTHGHGGDHQAAGRYMQVQAAIKPYPGRPRGRPGFCDAVLRTRYSCR